MTTAASRKHPPLAERVEKVGAQLSVIDGPIAAFAVANITGMTVSQALSTLHDMKLQGLAEQVPTRSGTVMSWRLTPAGEKRWPMPVVEKAQFELQLTATGHEETTGQDLGGLAGDAVIELARMLDDTGVTRLKVTLEWEGTY
jgi:hypothetical protein